MTLCLIAGQGRLPGLLVERLEAMGQAPVLAELDGFAMENRGDRPVIVFRIETLGSFLADLVSRGVTQVCFAGAIGRPRLEPGRVDRATLRLVPRMMMALRQGDDAALRVVLAVFQEAGIAVRAAHEVLPDLLPPHGVATRARPDEHAKRDAKRAA